LAFCLLFLPFSDFCHGSLFTLLLLLNSTWLGPGGEAYTISPAGSGPVPYPGQACHHLHNRQDRSHAFYRADTLQRNYGLNCRAKLCLRF